MINFFKISLDDILKVIGACTVILVFLQLLFVTVPKLGTLRKNCWKYIANKWKYKRFEKKAIALDIENAVNETVSDLQSELPAGWIPKASIKWVDKNIKENDLDNEEMILRIRPIGDQDENLINGIFFFFSKAIFPKTKDIIPENTRMAVALQISRRTIKDKRPFLINKFEDNLLESAIKDDYSIISFIDKFDEIDKKGFFTGSFLREIHEIATRSRFKKLRNNFDQELNGVLQHIQSFVQQMNRNSNAKWSRMGPATSYAFLLVANPNHSSVDPYVSQVKRHLLHGVDRIYIMGTYDEKYFVKKVISALSKIPNCDLLEVFDLNRDYRGNRNGIGALFIRGSLNQEVEEKIDKYFTNNIKDS